MGYELKQELKLTQSLVMTPQLQLAIKLLQLSRLELEELVREEVQANPVLEDTAETEAPEAQRPEPEKQEKPEVDWQAYLEERNDFRSGGIDFNQKDEEDDFMGNISSAAASLNDHLLWQLKMNCLPAEEISVGEYIIGNIDDDGYLRLVDGDSLDYDAIEAATIKEISSMTGAPEELCSSVLSKIQMFDPVGAGSRNLRECLLVQARNLPVRDTVVEEIILNHLEKLARKNYKGIAKSIGVTVEDIYEAVKVINKCLNPTPGAGFGSEEARAILPDIYIHKVGEEYVISLNEDGMPKLKISPYYRQVLKGDGNGQVTDQAKGYIQDKLRSAVWLIKSVHQRQRTIFKVVECIVKFQKDFLDKGLQYLKPLVLKDVAEEIGVHESTVSRVTSSKYVQTPRGLFELKYFFSTGMSNDDGSDMAVEYIKEKIRNIIKAEDPKNPLSDMQIVDMLKQSGISVARRTASKYREAMGVQSSNRRKVHY